MTESTTISARGLVKQFRTKSGAVSAVNGIDLQVGRGETFGLIGPDGAGKTTTTRVILGLLTRTAGESRVLGYDSMRDTYAIRERVGYIAQQFALPADMTVAENMRFFANVQGVSRGDQRKRIPELLAFAGLERFTGRLAGQLSGGMKKKLALACSLVHEPQVVMLDERECVSVDLRPYFNSSFIDETPGDGKGGWDDWGADNDLRNMVVGKQILAGVPFVIVDPRKNNDRSCIILRYERLPHLPGIVKGIKVVQGERGLFVAMPSRRLPDGTYQDVAYPSTREMTEKVRNLVLEHYHNAVGVRVRR